MKSTQIKILIQKLLIIAKYQKILKVDIFVSSFVLRAMKYSKDWPLNQGSTKILLNSNEDFL